MGSTKDYYFEVQQENFIAWAKDNHGIELDQDEDPDTWERLGLEYSSMQDAMEEEAEYRWLRRRPYTEFFNEFARELVTASELLEQPLAIDKAQTLYKLVYAHAITLLESLISSVVRSIVAGNPVFIAHIAIRYDDLSKRKFTLKEIIDHPKGVESIVLKTLSDLSFHNPHTIKAVMDSVFGKHMKGLDLRGISPICAKRHDIIHRNGRTISDDPINLDLEEVRQVITVIRAFAADLEGRIYNAVEEEESEPF